MTDGSRARGQSETLGVMLLLAITITGATAVVAFGGVALQDSRESAAVGNAENAMTQLDSQASLVAHGPADTQRASFGRGDGEARVDPEAGWMRVEIIDENTGQVDEVLLNLTLGAVVYETEETTIAYQGGGVWRQTTAPGSRMVSPPEFHYRGTTLTLPLVTVDGDTVLNRNVVITQPAASTATYPNASAGKTNPLRTGTVSVTVHSRYYRAWATFFEQRTDGVVSTDATNGTATIDLVAPNTQRELDDALSASSPGDDFAIEGGGTHPAFVDGYDSSVGNYSTSQGTNGTVTTAGDFDMGGNANVTGNVRSGGAVNIGASSSTVGGDVMYTTTKSINKNAEIGGEVYSIGGVESAEEIDSLVNGVVSDLEEHNENNETSAIENERLDFDGNESVTLEDGRYYLNNVSLDSKELVLDNSEGDIIIAVGGDVALQNGGNITVTNGGDDQGVVKLYVQGNADVDDGSHVAVPGDDASRLWLYGTSDATITMQGSQGNPITFVGVTYAPGDNSQFSTKHADVYGSVAAGQINVETGAAIHYDRDLRTIDPLAGPGNTTRVTYLHVSVTPLNVTAA